MYIDDKSHAFSSSPTLYMTPPTIFVLRCSSYFLSLFAFDIHSCHTYTFSFNVCLLFSLPIFTFIMLYVILS